ncbi:hypothetical protein KIPB_008132, partial [Kipferlia bialata]
SKKVAEVLMRVNQGTDRDDDDEDEVDISRARAQQVLLVDSSPISVVFDELPSLVDLDAGLDFLSHFLMPLCWPLEFQELDPDTAPKSRVFHCSHHGPQAMLGVIAKRLFACGLVVWDHGMLWRERLLFLGEVKSLSPFVRNVLILFTHVSAQTVLRYADIIAPCNSSVNVAWESRIASTFGSTTSLVAEASLAAAIRQRISPVLNGTAAGRVGDAPSGLRDGPVPIIALLSHVYPLKDIITAIQSADAMVHQYGFKHFEMRIYGSVTKDRPYTERCKKIITERGISFCCKLMGLGSPTAVLKAAHIFINTSRSEGLPLALLEAGMATIPVVCTDVGASREIVEPIGSDGKSTGERFGIVCRAGDSTGCAAAIIALLAGLPLDMPEVELKASVAAMRKRAENDAQHVADMSIDEAEEIHPGIRQTLVDGNELTPSHFILHKCNQGRPRVREIGKKFAKHVVRHFAYDTYLREHEQQIWAVDMLAKFRRQLHVYSSNLLVERNALQRWLKQMTDTPQEDREEGHSVSHTSRRDPQVPMSASDTGYMPSSSAFGGQSSMYQQPPRPSYPSMAPPTAHMPQSSVPEVPRGLPRMPTSAAPNYQNMMSGRERESGRDRETHRMQTAADRMFPQIGPDSGRLSDIDSARLSDVDSARSMRSAVPSGRAPLPPIVPPTGRPESGRAMESARMFPGRMDTATMGSARQDEGRPMLPPTARMDTGRLDTGRESEMAYFRDIQDTPVVLQPVSTPVHPPTVKGPRRGVDTSMSQGSTLSIAAPRKERKEVPTIQLNALAAKQAMRGALLGAVATAGVVEQPDDKGLKWQGHVPDFFESSSDATSSRFSSIGDMSVSVSDSAMSAADYGIGDGSIRLPQFNLAGSSGALSIFGVKARPGFSARGSTQTAMFGLPPLPESQGSIRASQMPSAAQSTAPPTSRLNQAFTPMQEESSDALSSDLLESDGFVVKGGETSSSSGASHSSGSGPYSDRSSSHGHSSPPPSSRSGSGSGPGMLDGVEGASSILNPSSSDTHTHTDSGSGSHFSGSEGSYSGTGSSGVLGSMAESSSGIVASDSSGSASVEDVGGLFTPSAQHGKREPAFPGMTPPDRQSGRQSDRQRRKNNERHELSGGPDLPELAAVRAWSQGTLRPTTTCSPCPLATLEACLYP